MKEITLNYIKNFMERNSELKYLEPQIKEAISLIAGGD